MKKLNSNRGFTVVELLLAMAIFSFVMVTIVVAFNQIMRSYRQGVASQKTQEASRELVDLIGKEARVADNIQTIQNKSDNPVRYVCFDEETGFEYDTEQRTISFGESEGCSPSATGEVEQIIGGELQVVRFNVGDEPLKSANGITLGINIDLIVATNNADENGDGDLLDGEVCDPSLPGAHFCSTSRLTTSIGLRGEGITQ